MSTFSGNRTLEEVDPEVAELISHELERQFEGLEMIASENFTSRAVMSVLGTCLTNKYSEGKPFERYYGGNQIIDKVESLCQKRALQAFHLDPEKWGVNVQPYSGSPANFAVYTGLLSPHDRIMGLDLPSGGHLTHGYQTDKKKVSATSIFFESMPYQVKEDGYVDYDQLEKNASLFRPKLIISGGSAYPRDWDYQRMRKIADKNNAYLMSDMAHISGIVASQECANPFDFCDVVTTTTHKTLRGPRAGMIFFRKGKRIVDGKEIGDYNFEESVNSAVFPSLQGGPHENTIGAIAVALKEVMDPSFKTYIQQVKKNAKTIAEELIKLGYQIQSGGTDNHLVLWNVRNSGLTGSKVEKLFEYASISVNKNSIFGDTSAAVPGGIRLGTPALTTRGFNEDDMKTVVQFLHRGIQISLKIQETSGKLLKDFKDSFDKNEDLKTLKREVEQFSKKFPL